MDGKNKDPAKKDRDLGYEIIVFALHGYNVFSI